VVAVSADPSPPAYLTKRSGKTNLESITSDEAQWAAFVQVNGLEDRNPGAGLRLLQSLGLSATDSTALWSHIQASIADANTYSQEVSVALCAEKATIQTSRDLYAQALQDMDAKVASRQAVLIAKMSDVISPHSKENFYTWATQQLRPHLTLVSTDHAMRIAMENVDPAVELELFCSALAPNQTQRAQGQGAELQTPTKHQ
jgi:hypothetical protein